MNIVIFSDSIRPFEHIIGLIDISKISKKHRVFFITKNKDLYKKIEDRTNNISNIFNHFQNALHDVFLILSADLIFGSPNNWRKQFLRLTSIFMRKRYSIHLRPGKVTKPSGFLSNYKESLKNLFVQYVSYKFFNAITLVADKSDMYYCKSAYSKPFPAMKIFPSPKLFTMSKKKVKDKTSRNIILFSPTHRKLGEKSPLDKLILSKQFLKKLHIDDTKVVYTTHPSSFKFHETNSYIEYFDDDWSKIKCVVTDYSSIGADFSLCGGSVIYYIPDFLEFFKENGDPFFFNNEILGKSLAYNEDELINRIKNVNDYKSILKEQPLETYFDDIYTKVQE